MKAAVKPEGKVGFTLLFVRGIIRAREEERVAFLIELRCGVVPEVRYRGVSHLHWQGIVPDFLGLWLGGIEPGILAGGIFQGEFPIVVAEIGGQGITYSFHLLEGLGLVLLGLSGLHHGRHNANPDNDHCGTYEDLHHVRFSGTESPVGSAIVVHE